MPFPSQPANAQAGAEQSRTLWHGTKSGAVARPADVPLNSLEKENSVEVNSSPGPVQLLPGSKSMVIRGESQ